jgi:hypothetical protein
VALNAIDLRLVAVFSNMLRDERGAAQVDGDAGRLLHRLINVARGLREGSGTWTGGRRERRHGPAEGPVPPRRPHLFTALESPRLPR